MTDLADTLRAARALISAPERWVQGVYARTEAGGKLHNGWETGAVRWCALGAIEHVTRRFVTAPIDDALLRGAGLERDADIYDYNDSHTHAEVLAMFDRAIELAEEQS